MTEFVKETVPEIVTVRPCEQYRDEYRLCRGLGGRLHQYYVSGKLDDCYPWMDDYRNCKKFQKNQDFLALEKLIDTEKQRREVRLARSKANDVWEYRDSPPEDWKAPLPERLARPEIPKSKTESCVIS